MEKTQHTPVRTDDEWDRLIAAAPTMYEGIGDFLAAYDRARIGDWDHGKLIDWLGEQVARLRFVYAKAEGRADG